jgi:hypothetical protein
VDKPGADLVDQGVRDLATGVESVEALLVSIGARRLAALGHALPPTVAVPETRLYELLAREDVDSAHARYNTFVRRLVSYERAAEREQSRALAGR